jgi:hypothetical protein
LYSNNWDPETKRLFQAISRYRRACGKYIHGKPSPEGAQRRLESAFEVLLDALSSPKVIERLEVVIAAGAAGAERTALSLKGEIEPDDMELEIQMAAAFGLKPREVSKAVELSDKDETPLIEIRSPSDLIARVEEFHDALIEKTEQARGIDTRVEKKKRKRNIGQAVTSILFGSGCAVINTYTLAGMPFMATSYAASLAAFHAAARDIVGERPKD